MNIRLIVFFLIPVFSFSQSSPTSVSEIETMFLRGKTQGAIQALNSNISRYRTQKSEQAKLIQNYNLLGEIYLSKMEFEQALKIWQSSEEVTRKFYGENSIQMAEISMLYSKFHSFKISRDSALYYAKRAVEICRRHKSEISAVPIHKIYRQFAFATKIILYNEPCHNSRVLARKILDTALYYNKTLFNNDKLFTADVLSDIGNTYCDETFCYSLDGNKATSDELLLKANSYYDLAIKIREGVLGKKNYPIASAYYLKALSFIYNNQKEYKPNALINLQKAFVSNTVGYEDLNIKSCPNHDSKFINSSFAMLMYSNKIDEFYREYLVSKDTSLLRYAYKHSIEAIKLWRRTVDGFRGEEVHIALETYGNSPLVSAIRATSLYYESNHKSEVERALIEWLDLIKYESILKAQLTESRHSIRFTEFSIEKVQEKLGEKQSAIEFQTIGDNIYTSIISKHEYYFLVGNVYLNLNKIDSLNFYLLKHQEKKFCHYSKEIYDSLFRPILTRIPKNISELIIIPSYKLSTIPFDALVINSAKSYREADFLVKHYEITEALSLRLWLLPRQNTISRNIAVLAPKYTSYTPLPFNDKLIRSLHKTIAVTEFNSNSKSDESGILHLMGHTFINPKNSRSNSLLVSDSGKMELSDISKMKLNFALGIVSGCETAVGNEERGEGRINFSRNLYLAGVKSSISTLWKVDDESTASLLESFYNNLLSGSSAGNSLYKSKLEYLANAKSVDDYDPYYWAGLVYTGQDLVLEKDSTLNFFLISLVVLAVAFLLFKKFFL